MDTVPFGKYKNQSITSLMKDTKYIQWLKQQKWFKERYGEIYNIVVLNNFQNEDQPTPEHNKLQAKFLDNDFCSTFTKLLTNTNDTEFLCFKRKFEPNDGMDVNLKIYRNITEIENSVTTILQKSLKDLRQDIFENKIFSYQWENEINDTLKQAQQYADNKLQEFKQRVQNLIVDKYLSCNVYESDRKCEIYPSLSEKWYTRCYKIEIKTSLGNDYPCVLRKMKRQIQLLEKSRKHYTKILLLVDKFESDAISKKQLVQIFKNENIKVVFYNELL